MGVEVMGDSFLVDIVVLFVIMLLLIVIMGRVIHKSCYSQIITDNIVPYFLNFFFDILKIIKNVLACH